MGERGMRKDVVRDLEERERAKGWRSGGGSVKANKQTDKQSLTGAR